MSDDNILEHLTVGSFVDSISDDEGIVSAGGRLSVGMTGLPMEELTAMTAADIHDADTLLVGDTSATDTVSISMGTLEERLRGEYVSDVNLGRGCYRVNHGRAVAPRCRGRPLRLVVVVVAGLPMAWSTLPPCR